VSIVPKTDALTATVCGAALPFVPRSAPWLRAAFVLVAGAQLLLWGWSRRSGLVKPVLAVVELARDIRARSPQPQPAA
jgi:hypothetical protein